ncbi:MAG: hypothetical protein KJ069_17005 [Anaerolineae bacterium]|nr:hypothetical protein [Anaerolineae bacterium]
MSDKTVKKILFEITQIDQLLVAYADLLETIQTEAPDIVQTTAVASLLHSFYNGIENIFKVIASEIDHATPEGHAWHQQLIEQMTTKSEQRPAVISAETANVLSEYLSFRHFYRHSYSFFLEWARMENLVLPLGGVWGAVKNELQSFIKGL